MKLPKLKRGVHKIWAVYVGKADVDSSKSAVVKLKVVKKKHKKPKHRVGLVSFRIPTLF